MDYREIEMFRAVMDQGSISGGARSLGVSQPAVSHAIAKFEKRLGFALFRRSGRRLLPTTEAKLLHAEASHIIDGVSLFGNSARDIHAGERGMLTIASNPNSATCWLPSVVAAFLKERPQVRMRCLTRSSEEVRELAASSAFDLGLAEAPFTQPELLLHRYIMHRVVVLSRTHRLASCKSLTPTMLANEPVVAVRRTSSWNWVNVTRAFDLAGATLNIVAECEFAAMALNIVSAGAGICITDPISATTIGAGLIQCPFLPSTPYEIGMLRPAHGHISILARHFADALHKFILPFVEKHTRAEKHASRS